MKFQDIVRCKRRELGLTQEQAARRLGVSWPFESSAISSPVPERT